MNRYIPYSFILLSGLFFSGIANAVHVPDLYSGRVPVNSQEKELQKAGLVEALQQVFIKVTGHSTSLQNKALQDALTNPQAYLQLYNYITMPVSNNGKQLFLNAQFDARAINTLINQAGQNIWGNERPLVMLWLIDETKRANGQTSPILIGTDAQDEWPKLLKFYANQRGLPIILPILDLADETNIAIEDFNDPNSPKIQQASKRYGSHVILIGHITTCFNTQWCSNWVLLAGGKQVAWQLTNSEQNSLIQETFDKVSDQLASRYGIDSTANLLLDHITVTIEGVGSADDYAKVVAYLHHLTQVKQVEVVAVESNKVTFELQLAGDPATFIRAVALEHRLRPIDTIADDEIILPETVLSYQWLT